MSSVVPYTGLSPQVIEVEEASAGVADAFKDGDLVKATAGELVIATDGVILGIARKTATGTASTKIPVELLNLNEIYVCRYHTDATTEALIGDVLDFTFTIGDHRLEESAASTDVYCVGLHPTDGLLASGRLLVRFFSSLLVGTA